MKNIKQKIIIPLTLLLTFITSIFGDSKTKEDNNKNTNVIKEVSPDEAYEIIKNNKVIILDVREKEELKTGKIKNSINIPLGNLQKEITKKIPDKKAIILVYCRSGRRSMIAAKILAEMGYKNPINIKGGIIEWEKSGLPLDK